MVTDEGAIYVTSNKGYNWKAAIQETVSATLNRFTTLPLVYIDRKSSSVLWSMYLNDLLVWKLNVLWKLALCFEVLCFQYITNEDTLILYFKWPCRTVSSGISGASYYTGTFSTVNRSPEGKYIAVSSRGNFFLTWEPGQVRLN